MRLIFMGTPDFAVPVLERLVNNGHQILAVFTQPDRPAGRGHKPQPPPVKILAGANLIPVYQPEKIRKNEDVRQIFEEARPDAAIVAAYGKILPEWLLNIPKLGCINVHSSLLPKYRGAAPINWAIARGDIVTGVTIMQMDPGMDTGPMWAQRETEIGRDETAIDLTERLSKVGAELLAETLPRIEAGSIKPTPQDDSQATYAPMLKREDGLIDWTRPAAEIANRVRGFQPWPGAYTLFRGSRLIVWCAQSVPGNRPATGEAGESTGSDEVGSNALKSNVQPGTVVSVDKTGPTVACGEGSRLQLIEVQLEGKRRVPGRDFANGAHLSAGQWISD